MPLLKNVCAPSGDSAEDKDRGEHLSRDVHLAICTRTVEIQVGDDFLFVGHQGFHFLADLLQQRVAPLVARVQTQLTRTLLYQRVAGVAIFVDRMPKAHQHFLLGPLFSDHFLCMFNASHGVEQVHGCLVGASVQRTSQRADGGTH